jgi:hypothetical protein
VDTLVLQSSEERFGHRVVVADSGAADRLPEVMLLQRPGELLRGVIAAAIGMENRIAGEGIVAGGHLDRRPALRLAVWRATWAVLRHCDVLAAKHTALTSRDGESKLADAQARVACAASLPRWIYALTVHGTRWDPRIAAGQLGHHHAMAA